MLIVLLYFFDICSEAIKLLSLYSTILINKLFKFEKLVGCLLYAIHIFSDRAEFCKVPSSIKKEVNMNCFL